MTVLRCPASPPRVWGRHSRRPDSCEPIVSSLVLELHCQAAVLEENAWANQTSIPFWHVPPGSGWTTTSNPFPPTFPLPLARAAPSRARHSVVVRRGSNTWL